jgi:hypothetical protein
MRDEVVRIPGCELDPGLDCFIETFASYLSG